MLEEVITLNIQGEGVNFQEGTDIRVLAQSLTSLQKIVEKIYLHSEGKSKMTDADYENLKIKIQNPHSGSWITDVYIGIQSVVIPVVPFVLKNSGDILQTIRNVYDFITFKIRAREEGKNVQIEINDNSGNVYYNNIHGNNTVIIECPSQIPELAEELSRNLQNLTKAIDGISVSKVDLSNGVDSLALDYRDNKRFKTQTFISEDAVFIKGIIREAKADSYSGVIRVIETSDRDLEIGEDYHFVSKNIFTEEEFGEIYLKETEFMCRKKISVGPENNFDGRVKTLVIEEKYD